MTDCLETRLNDIVRIDIFLDSQANITVPPTAPISSLSSNNPFNGSAIFSAALSPSAASEVVLDASPTLKVTNARQQAGNIYTHDLQAFCILSRSEMEAAVTALLGQGFHILYTRADGSQDLSYSLPNTSLCDIEESHTSPTVTSTLKIKLSSLSPSIPIITE